MFADMYLLNPFSKGISEIDVCMIDYLLWLYERIPYFHLKPLVIYVWSWKETFVKICDNTIQLQN